MSGLIGISFQQLVLRKNIIIRAMDPVLLEGVETEVQHTIFCLASRVRQGISEECLGYIVTVQ